MHAVMEILCDREAALMVWRLGGGIVTHLGLLPECNSMVAYTALSVPHVPLSLVVLNSNLRLARVLYASTNVPRGLGLPHRCLTLAPLPQ